MTILPKHFDEARSAAISKMAKILAEHPTEITACAVVDDLFGRVSINIWLRSDGQKIEKQIKETLTAACGQFWTNRIHTSKNPEPEKDENPLMQLAWEQGIPHSDNTKLRINDRVRHHSAWFLPQDQFGPIWRREEGPPVVVFHGFKGGAGRTTLLASYALAHSRRGHHVVAVDMDLDAPGIGVLLAADAVGTTARWGTVDFLLESPSTQPLDDYFHICAQPDLTGDGRIEVFPTGQLNDEYLPKLARVDLDVNSKITAHPFSHLLNSIKCRNPDIILIDGRAGLASSAGLLLSGIAHLHVLIATASEQSMQGLERVVRHLGLSQAEHGRDQGECVVVQALVPENVDAAKVAQEIFSARVEEIFRNGYYARESSEDFSNWSLADLETESAPHMPIPVSYRARLAHFATIHQVADLLANDSEYTHFHSRLDDRLQMSNDLSSEDVLDV